MARGKVQIATGILIAESEASDTNRSYAPVPGAAILLEPLPPNPFDGQRPAEGLNESTDPQAFNRNLAAWGLNTRPAKEAMVSPTSPASLAVLVSLAVLARPCSFGQRCKER